MLAMAQPTTVNSTRVGEFKGWIALGLGLLWLAGFGSIAAIMLAGSARRERRQHGLAPSGVVRAATVIGWLGLAACVLGAALALGLTASPA